MSAKKPKAAKVSEHDIDGHSVRIVDGPDREELWIDGTRRRFFRNEQGYLLADRAYVPSNASFLDAVRAYFKEADPPKSAEPPKSRKGGR